MTKKFTSLLFLIPFILTIIWFRNGLIIGGGDEALLFYDTQRAFEISSSTWMKSATGFPMLFWLSRAPFLFVVDFLHQTFFLPSFFLQAFTFFFLMCTGTVSTFYLVLHFLTKSKCREIIALLSGLFYLLNPYSMSQIWGRGQYAQYFSFALIPLMLLLFVIALKKRSYIFAPLIALISLPFATAYGFMTVIFIQWLLFSLYGMFLIVTDKEKKKNILFLVFFCPLTLLLWLMVHAWWIVPIFLSGAATFGNYLNNAQENINSLIGVSNNFKPWVLIRLLQETYFFAPSAFSPHYANLFFQIISFITPLFLLFGLIAVFKKKELQKTKIFVWLFILGFLVSLGANLPFGSLFIWLFQNIPALQMFRNPYEKFGIVLLLAYAPLFAIGVVSFFQLLQKKRLLTKVSGIGLGFIICLFLSIYLWPMWSGKIVAFPDGKIGLPQMHYYNELENFLEKNSSENTRILMTPIWSGDGAFYLWGEKRYQGVDPMPFFMKREVISSTLQIPLYYDFIRSIRQNIYQQDLSGALSLLRVNYLVDREDAVFVSPIEKNHVKFLTKENYPPSKFENLQKVVCENQTATSEGGTAWIICDLPREEQDLSDIKYLHIVVKTAIPANLDVAVKDINGNRPNWYGKIPGEYAVQANEWTTILIPLGVPTDINNMTDFKKIVSIDVRAHPFYRHNDSVSKIEIQGIWLDPGLSQKVTSFLSLKDFGKLQVYRLQNNSFPPEVGVYNSVEIVQSFDELLSQSSQEKEQLKQKGFILSVQNQKKDLSKIKTKNNLKVLEIIKFNNERFFIQFEKSDEGFIILSKSFNPEWKLIQGVSSDSFSGNLFDDINLLKKIFISEEDHFVANGYANLWKIDGSSDTIGIVFRPQLLADIGAKISWVGFVGCLLLISFFVVKKKIYGKK